MTQIYKQCAKGFFVWIFSVVRPFRETSFVRPFGLLGHFKFVRPFQNPFPTMNGSRASPCFGKFLNLRIFDAYFKNISSLANI